MTSMYILALVFGLIVGALSANPKFLEPYIFGFAVALVITTIGRWLI